MDKINIHPALNDKHAELRKKVRIFAEQEIKQQAASLDEAAEFSSKITKQMGDFGLFGINLPLKYGGQNLDTLSYIIAVEELARVDSSQAATVAAHNSLGIAPIYKYGTEAQKEKFLPRLTTGKHVWAFGLTEVNAGSDAAGVETTAILDKGSWVINGKKVYITNSSSEAAVGATLAAVTGKKGDKNELSAILVDRSTKGYTTAAIRDKMLWRAVDTGKITLENCQVPEENLLGERGKGVRIMLETLDSGRLSIAAIGLGRAQGALEMALEHTKYRTQFNKPIAKFQAIAFKLADMATKLENARNTLYKACWLKDSGHSFGKEAAIAKLYCSEIAKEIADEALQIHGAAGLMKGHPIERFYRDQRILQIGEGTSEILKLVISRHLGI